jgi:hypothetical protein
MSAAKPHDLLEEGWQRIRAGLALIVWSRRASRNEQALDVVAAAKDKFESAAGHEEVHKEFGRLICWIAFGVVANCH